MTARSPQEEYAQLAYTKAIHQTVQEYLRGLMTSGMTSTDIRSEDLPPLNAQVPGSHLREYLQKLEDNILAIDVQLGDFTLVRKPSSTPTPSTPPDSEDPFRDDPA